MNDPHRNPEKWFDETVEVPPQARELLEKYSGIPSDEVVDTVVVLVSEPCKPIRSIPSR
jgi:hypothetical protein